MTVACTENRFLLVHCDTAWTLNAGTFVQPNRLPSPRLTCKALVGLVSIVGGISNKYFRVLGGNSQAGNTLKLSCMPFGTS